MKKMFQIFSFISMLTIVSIQYSCNQEDVVTTSDPEPVGFTINNDFAAWSPNGNSIAYIGKKSDTESRIYSIDTNLNNIVQLTETYGDSPSLTPDGQWLIFGSFGNIYKKRVGSDSSSFQLTTTGGCYFPSLSKDGNLIAYDSDDIDGRHIWIMRTDGSHKKKILLSNMVTNERAPSWFPDGIRLAIQGFTQGIAVEQIAIIDTSGNVISILTNDNVFNRNPKVSNNGQYITWWKNISGGTIMLIP
jgi:Tol biopolymer transport system component